MAMSRVSFLKWNTSLVAGLLLCMWTGCLRTDNQEPLNNKTLQSLIAGEKHWPRLSKPDENLLFDITGQQAGALVKALSPIKSTKTGGVPSNSADYILMFQPGRNPIVFHVHLADDHLVYAERTYLYEGGDGKAFKQIADSIMATTPGKTGAIADSTMEEREGQSSINNKPIAPASPTATAPATEPPSSSKQ
jgi:hypothetical protein